MTEQELYSTLHAKFSAILAENNLKEAQVRITSKGLSPEEAIGKTARRDYPILTGKEIMLQAEFDGAVGQAFTAAPADFSGTLQDIMAMDIMGDMYARGLFIAAMNAVLRKLGKIDHTIHCKNEQPEECSLYYAKLIQEENKRNLVMIGFQPALTARLAPLCNLRVLDISPALIGKTKSGIVIEDGAIWAKAVQEADMVLCTGSTLCNGSFIHFMDLPNVIFFGSSGAAAVTLLGLRRLCPMSL